MNRPGQHLPFHHVFYLTRPDFIKHDHIHRRKVHALRAAGLRASLVSFVPRDLFASRSAEYRAAAADGLRKVVLVPSAEAVNPAVRRFFGRRLLVYRRLLVQVLLCDPEPLLQLCRTRYWGRRLRCVIEHEGDIASECLYRWTFDPVNRPPDEPPPQFKAMYDGIVVKQGEQLTRADGAILVTPEHRQLWEQRLGHPVDALTLPTLFDPARFSFSLSARARLRSKWGLDRETVLVYSGSVSMPWQRFDAVCRLIATLQERQLAVRLLALIHPDGHAQARQLIDQSRINAVTRLEGVAPEAMAGWLSAADVALFLRHSHLMNRIVTSAKLGEYLAAGLPLLTTWACPYYRPFAQKHNAALHLPDSLALPPDFERRFRDLAAKGADPGWRRQLSQAVLNEFSEDTDLMNAYADYIRQRLD